MTWQNLFLPSCDSLAIWRSISLAFPANNQSCHPSNLQHLVHLLYSEDPGQCLSRKPFYQWMQSVTRTWLEVMTEWCFNVALTETGKESFDSWLYGSIVNNPVDPWWRFVTWLIIILGVWLTYQFLKIGSQLQILNHLNQYPFLKWQTFKYIKSPENMQNILKLHYFLNLTIDYM